ncbi:STAS domain-containing protein [Rummeliibacillus sp. JY-2-4R]
MNSLVKFQQYLLKYAESLSKEIVDYNIKKLDISVPDDIVKQSVINNRKFFEFLGSSFNWSMETVKSEFIKWHKTLLQPEDSGFGIEALSTLIKPYADTRLQLISMLTKYEIDQGLSIEEVLFVNSRLSYLLDLSITETILERERQVNETEKEHKQKITALSTPVVPLRDGMAVLPLVGEFDLDKSEHIMTHTISKISELKVECLIIDLSGIILIDDEIASRILEIHHVLQLLGIDAIFTGIRPELSIKIITAGIDLSSLKTFATVQQAIISMFGTVM